MLANRQTKLDEDEKSKFKISLDKEAYLFELDKVIEERCDQFDYELEEDGFVIISQDLFPVAVSIFNYKVVAYKSNG
ncbi:MAG: hypothetical protein ACJAS4_003762 [Bacteriovoracaceae bacterium]|jgi:hypothetical protein